MRVYMLVCIIRRLCVYICWYVLYVGYACIYAGMYYTWVMRVYMLVCIIRGLCVYICWYVLYIYPHENAGDMHIIALACINIICYHYSEQKKNFFMYGIRGFTVTIIIYIIIYLKHYVYFYI